MPFSIRSLGVVALSFALSVPAAGSLWEDSDFGEFGPQPTPPQADEEPIRGSDGYDIVNGPYVRFVRRTELSVTVLHDFVSTGQSGVVHAFPAPSPLAKVLFYLPDAGLGSSSVLAALAGGSTILIDGVAAPPGACRIEWIPGNWRGSPVDVFLIGAESAPNLAELLIARERSPIRAFAIAADGTFLGLKDGVSLGGLSEGENAAGLVRAQDLGWFFEPRAQLAFDATADIAEFTMRPRLTNYRGPAARAGALAPLAPFLPDLDAATGEIRAPQSRFTDVSEPIGERRGPDGQSVSLHHATDEGGVRWVVADQPGFDDFIAIRPVSAVACPRAIGRPK